MKRIVYAIICPCSNGDDRYHIDSTWTSLKKAEKRKEELNEKSDFLIKEYGWNKFQVEYLRLSK